MLGAAQGSKLRVRTEGPDAREALKAVQTLFDDRFGEE
jgi:phosphotransferase system HPr-like phosphotransfer protein